MHLITKRFFLRKLTIEDATLRYLSWLKDTDTSRFIETAGNIEELAELQAYIENKNKKEDALILGIFTKDKNLHIGNIKLEPINLEMGYAILGILIGDTNFRGVGVAGEVILEIAQELRMRNFKVLVLGVNRENEAAIKAYKKIGFTVQDSEYLNFKEPEINYEMHLKLSPV